VCIPSDWSSTDPEREVYDKPSGRPLSVCLIFGLGIGEKASVLSTVSSNTNRTAILSRNQKTRTTSKKENRQVCSLNFFFVFWRSLTVEAGSSLASWPLSRE
jgi:hypothetical protein